MLRGLSEIYIDEVTDSAEAYTPAGKPEQLIPAGELKIKKSVGKTQVYYDNALIRKYEKKTLLKWKSSERPSVRCSMLGSKVRA